MIQQTVSFVQLSRIALDLIAKADIKADDDTIALVQGTRNMLRAIVSGDLIVSQPAPPAPPAPPPGHALSEDQ